MVVSPADALVMNILAGPNRVLENTTRLPSGDHVGDSSIAGFCVRFRRPLPSGFMIHTSRFPLRSETNTIEFPSGDHTGRVSRAALLVIRTTFVPSEFIV